MALRKADEPQALLKALAAAQPLIQASPVELPHYAGARCSAVVLGSASLVS